MKKIFLIVSILFIFNASFADIKTLSSLELQTAIVGLNGSLAMCAVTEELTGKEGLPGTGFFKDRKQFSWLGITCDGVTIFDGHVYIDNLTKKGMGERDGHSITIVAPALKQKGLRLVTCFDKETATMCFFSK